MEYFKCSQRSSAKCSAAQSCSGVAMTCGLRLLSWFSPLQISRAGIFSLSAKP
jgi:hypothetical protein